MAYANNLNSYADNAEQPGTFAACGRRSPTTAPIWRPTRS